MLANATRLFQRSCVLFSLVVTFGLVVSVARLLPSQQAKLLFLDAREPLNTYCSPVSHCCERCGRSEHMLRSLALLLFFFLFLFLVGFFFLLFSFRSLSFSLSSSPSLAVHENGSGAAWLNDQPPAS